MPMHSTAESPEKGQRFRSTPALYFFEFQGQGGSERFRVQTTVKAAGGSQAEAQRIAARCWEKCEEGWPKEKVLEFRNSLYEEVTKCIGAGKDETPRLGDEKPPSGLQGQQRRQQQQQQQSDEHKKEEGHQTNGKAVKGALPSTDLAVAAAAAVIADVDMASSAAASAWETVNSSAGGSAPEQELPEPKTPAGGSRACKKRSVIQEDVAQDVPSDSAALVAVKYDMANRAWRFEFQRKEGGEKIRLQTTVAAAGGSRENAGRIARLCFAEVEAGASKEQALQLRAELYKRCGPPVVKPRLEPCETFRNLFGETVSINPAAKCAAGPGPKPWQELEQSDLDRFNGDEIYHYEKELGLGSTKRSLEERIARIEQMAQKTTVQHLVKPACGKRDNLGPKSITHESGNGLADIAEYLDSAESEQEFEARFLQAFLAVSAEERQHTTAAEVGTLERIARIPDAAFLSVAERRVRLKENLWASRSSPSSSRESFFLKSWLTSQGA